MANLEQNYGLTPLEKCQFFDCLKFLFYSLKRRFFFPEYRQIHFPDLYCLKKIIWNNGQFRTKTMG